MNRNYTPYLKNIEFEDDTKYSHYKTENEFFEIQRKYNSTESFNKNNVKRHLSENEELIPQDYFNDDIDNMYNNTIFFDKREFTTAKKNIGYNSNNIHFNNANYRKYISNLKNEGIYHSKPKKNSKKNISQNKNLLSPETYNIIQIYEAPPLELTPIMEVEKSDIKRRPPRYYRKKIIYSLEEDNETTNSNVLNINSNNYANYKINSSLRKNKFSNSKINNEILNDSLESVKNIKNNDYLKFKAKEEQTNPYNKKNEEKNTNYKRRDYRRFINSEKEEIKFKDSIDNIKDIIKNDQNISNIDKDKKNIETKIKENNIDKKTKKKNYVSQRNNRFNAKLKENQKNSEVKKEEIKNDLIIGKNKIDFTINYRLKYKNRFTTKDNSKKVSDNKNEIKLVYNTNENKLKKNALNTEDEKNEESILLNNSTEPKRHEIKVKKEENKEVQVNSYQVKNRNSQWQIKKNENINNISNKKDMKIDQENNQDNNNIKKHYLSNKNSKEGTSMKNIKVNKMNNDIIKKNNKNNNFSKYVYSFSVEKKSPKKLKEKTIYQQERKKNEINTNNQNNQQKNNTQKEKEQKIIYGLKESTGNKDNNIFLTISIKKDEVNKKENKVENKEKIRKELKINKINNTNLVNIDKNNYTYVSTINYNNKEEEEKNKTNENKNNIKENSPKKNVSKISSIINRNNKKNNLINEDKKDNKIDNNRKISGILDSKNDIELPNENNCESLNNTIYKSNNRTNHNFLAIKTTMNKSKIDNNENLPENKNVNNKDINNYNNANISGKGMSTNLSSLNIIEKKQNNNIINSLSNENDIKQQKENLNIRLTLRIPSLKPGNDINQFEKNDSNLKKKSTNRANYNHSIKVSYGSTTFKSQAEKKEKENDSKNINNINSINDINPKPKYSNYKIALNNNSNSNKTDENNIKTDENKNNKSTIDNNEKKLQEIKYKNNHSLYFSINSKK